MRAIVTGQVGVDKGSYLDAVSRCAAGDGHDLVICHVGRMMYAEAPDVPPGRILNLPLSRLNTLRRAVFKEILRIAERHENVLVNTRATFRWRHGLFPAFDFNQLQEFDADIYLSLLDNAESVHQRLLREHDLDHTLKDIMGQIYTRDFKMIDQSDMIVSLIPELSGGKPALSSGVERELHHAFEARKEVYLTWACRGTPSPFITETRRKFSPASRRRYNLSANEDILKRIRSFRA